MVFEECMNKVKPMCIKAGLSGSLAIAETAGAFGEGMAMCSLFAPTNEQAEELLTLTFDLIRKRSAELRADCEKLRAALLQAHQGE